MNNINFNLVKKNTFFPSGISRDSNTNHLANQDRLSRNSTHTLNEELGSYFKSIYDYGLKRVDFDAGGAFIRDEKWTGSITAKIPMSSKYKETVELTFSPDSDSSNQTGFKIQIGKPDNGKVWEIVQSYSYSANKSDNPTDKKNLSRIDTENIIKLFKETYRVSQPK